MKEPVQELDSYFQQLFARSRVNALIHLDTAGIIITVNPAFTAFFGYENNDLVGTHFSLLFTEEDRLNRKPWIEIETVLRKGQADDKNFMVHKNRQVSWVSGESILIDNEVNGKSVLKIIQDIHQHKDAEISLTRVNDFNESILQAIDDFVVLLDASLKVIKYNPSLLRVFHNGNETLIADFGDFIRPFDRNDTLLRKIMTVAETGIAFSKQVLEFMTPNGERVFELSCQPIYSKDSASGLVLVGHDVTIHKRAETEREDLMGFVVHELRNPLTSIRMSNDVMKMLAEEGEIKDLGQLVEKNKKQIERLTRMIAELYDAAKIGGGHFQLTLSNFDFDEMMEEAVETFRLLHPQFNINITGRTAVQVFADRYRILQVVSNYLSNAVKYDNDGRTIKINMAVDDQRLEVAVEDKGVGISAAQLPFLFDRFFRAEKTRSLEGIGLGLYLCRRIIHAHGGEVWAVSEDGKGSTFYFSLPIPTRGKSN